MSKSNNQNTIAAPQSPPPGQQPPATVPVPLPPVPAEAPSSSNNIRAVAPGWRFQPGNPGTMADTAKVVDSRVIDSSKIYRGGRSMELPPLQPSGSPLSFASNTVQAPASIVELARALKNDPQLIFEYVYNNIEWQPGWGVMKGALGTLLDGSGNSFDQSMLLIALLRQAGFTASYVLGQIRLTTVQYDSWFGTDSTFPNYYCCYWYAQYANIPCSAPVASGPDFIMDMSHVWVKVTVSGTTYMLDPSRKTYTRKSPVSGLATILGYNASTFLSNAQSGATVDPSGNFVQNMNTANIRNDLTTMTSNLVSYINGNTVGSAPAGTATVDDILGGREITPITLPFTWSTTLPYEMPGDVPTIWTGDVPLTHKTTLQVQYPLSTGGWAIDQTFTSDQLAGTRLTLTFDSTLHPVLSLNGTVLATGSEAQGVGSFNSILLTVNHNAFASPVYPQQWWQGAIYASTDNLYLIANAWGSAGPGQSTLHKRVAQSVEPAGFTNSEPAVGELMSVIWWSMIAQASQVADLVGRLNQTNMNFFHQVGIVYNNADTVNSTASAGTDIGGVSGFSSTLNFDFSQLARTNTVVAMHGVALEAATLAQFTGASPGVSTTTLVNKANRTAAATIGGTVTVGNTLTITVNDAALSGGTKSKTYTVISGNTLASIAAGLAALINADSDLSAIGVTATSSGAVVLISSDSINQTTYSSSTSVGATETISVVFLKIFLGTQSNWNTGANISATLVANGYNSTDMSGIYSSYLSGGYNTVVLPDRPGLKVNNAFTGWGDWIFPKYTSNGGAFGLINNSAKGGKSISCGFLHTDDQGNTYFGPPVCVEYGGMEESPILQDDSKPNPNGQSQSGDPVGLFTGDFYSSFTDISLGSMPFPYGLTFGRFYNSAQQYQKTHLGYGWKHNHDVSVLSSSNGMLGLGDKNATHAAASLAELYVSMDIASDSTQPLVKLVTMNLADKWWVDQIVKNTVVLTMSHGTFVYVRQPNGTFTSPTTFPSTLSIISGLYKITTPEGLVFNFNSAGRLTSMVHPAGVTVTYAYTGGVLTSITNGLGRTLTINYSGAVISSVSDGTGRSVLYGYDGSGNLQTFTDATSKVFQYEYDQPGRMTKIFGPVNPTVAVTTNVYDSLSRVKTQANALGQVTTLYLAGSRAEVVDPLLNATVRYFNRFGNTSRFINALGFETRTRFDGLQRTIRVTLPEGNYTDFTYNANHKLLTRTFVAKSGSGLSNVQNLYTYDSTWAKLKTATDGNGNVYTLGYDPTTGSLLTVTGPTVGGLTPQAVSTYNARGQVLTVTDATGIVTKFNYDAVTEKLTSVIADYNAGAGHLNLTTSFGYDAVGNLASITDPNGNQTTLQYDNQRRLTQTTSAAPFSYVAKLTYDGNGNLTSSQRQVTSDPTWQTVSVTRTLTDRVATVTDPIGKITTYTYDGADRLQAVTDPQGRTVQYGYDAVNRLSTFTDTSNNVADTETYTDNGLRKTTKDANNNVTQYSYDGFDRPSSVTFADSSTNQFTSYDGNSRLLSSVTRAGNAVSFTYDALGRLLTRAPSGQATETLSYDLASRLVSVSKPVVSGDPSTGLFQFAYDTAGRFVQEQYPDGKTVSHILDNNGNRTKTTWPDGYYITKSFDQLNRLTNIYLNGSGSPALTYGYDQLSRRTSVSMGNGTSTSYTFTLNNDLVSMAHNFVGASLAYSLSYNNAHQIVSAGVSDSSFVWHPASAGTITYGAADNTNKYSSVAGSTYSYDGDKNLSGDGVWTFAHNTDSRLVSASAGANSATYVYDPRGRQAKKTVNSVVTRFIYDGGRLIATYDTSGNLVNRYVHGPGVDEPAIQVTAGGAQSYFHADANASVVAVTNSSGAVANKYSYSPFGESAAIVGSLFGYTGQRYDSETGLYFFKARHYAPSTGRFLETDPIGYLGGDLNLYSYVKNDPVNFRDPLGLTPLKNMGPHSYGGNGPNDYVPGWGDVDSLGNPINPNAPMNQGGAGMPSVGPNGAPAQATPGFGTSGGGNFPAILGNDVIKGVVTWAQENPILAGVIGVGTLVIAGIGAWWLGAGLLGGGAAVTTAGAAEATAATTAAAATTAGAAEGTAAVAETAAIAFPGSVVTSTAPVATTTIASSVPLGMTSTEIASGTGLTWWVTGSTGVVEGTTVFNIFNIFGPSGSGLGIITLINAINLAAGRGPAIVHFYETGQKLIPIHMKLMQLSGWTFSGFEGTVMTFVKGG